MHEQGIAIYSRKSRFTGKGESVGNQIELCRQYLRAHEPDAPEPEIFEDDGFSGGDLNRPAFRRMMRAAEAGRRACTWPAHSVKSMPFSTATPENCLRIWRASSSGFIIAPRLNK